MSIIVAILCGLLCGLANWVRGGLWGEPIKAALRAVPFVGGALEAAWRSVGDRLLTTPVALVVAAAIAGAGIGAIDGWPIPLALLLWYLAFIPGWVWIGMGRAPGSGETWAETRKQRPTGFPGAWIRAAADALFGTPRADLVERKLPPTIATEFTIYLADAWSFRRRWAYDAVALALRGLLITAPAGALLAATGPVGWGWCAAGAVMPIAYEIGQHMPGRWRGTGAAEALFGFWLGVSLALAGG